MNNRLHYIDNLRVFCIIIVVFIHSAVTYSGFGSWYYNEPSSLNTFSKLFFAVFQTHAQAFSMSLFFFIAAYFIPASLERKGTKKFITDRLYRLGIPVLVYIFLIHPLCVKLVHPQLVLFDYITDGLRYFKFLGWTGPLWFALTLLIFSIIYALIYKYLPKSDKIEIKTLTLVLLISFITLFAFGIRLIFPIGTAFMNLQFCFFSAYIFMFSAGVITYRHSILDKIDLRKGGKWLLIAFGIGLPLWVLAIITGKISEGKMLISGGMNIPSFIYALWESLFCVAFIIALFGIAKSVFNTQNRITKILSDNTFGIYVFHAPVLIGISILAKGIAISVVPKFFIIGSISIFGSLIVSWLIRKIPVIGKIFN
jgi:glucans biosynthesis protein C